MDVVFSLLSILAIVLLTFGTAVFVAAEFSLTALERSTVEANARTGDRRDQLVRRAHRTLSFQLSGAQVGISITTLATGYLAEPVVGGLIRPGLDAMGIPVNIAGGLSLFLAVLIVTSLSMVFGELVPKNLAVARPVPTARAAAPFQLLFSMLFTPVIRLTNGSANWILRRLGIEPAEELRSARSAQELASLVRNSARSGSLDPSTALLVHRSLQFGERTAEELMTPRSKIEVLDAGDSVADLMSVAIRTGYSRFPIVEGDLDETIGVVHIKQVFSIPREERDRTRLAALALPVATVPSTLDGDAVMTQIRANGLQTALVVDEYGGTAGMVTVEDLIEEIVGDVRDEHDDATPDVVPAGAGWQVSGLLRIDEVAAGTGFRASEGEYETIGGLVLQELGHIPENGEAVELTAFDPDGDPHKPTRWLATVVRMDGRRIDLLELTSLGSKEDSHG
ncbi:MULTISPECIES: hemolysin family protein [unclassified Mycolicibacterium]|uniref:hemolysin family protein n=1 Tax=unclassified Mycolicibacterium TaxID=2636767 RepID=UPI0012DDEC28|nr:MULTISPECIES: hemolysin family protein [unclassified Mycolicibacterium]MUL85455.1 HlyC/CorC family transporter [Mycolicibacterium sp. CBMA 329]MUL88781.1 HlyC/CorC family transporter [Mycolicibacterium sp. CBMA 331]MUM03079.1 HlyC/CorC family transporter [Mycolicibacterium sp. CBMA 334]MUM24871.1 HlyC/CorC family transporter [Mycolicibacterium sp. CBMA 295]MUM40428.1 HlyC/CorC family transporter [Mycolicibacterium sp. CBMA 247]